MNEIVQLERHKIKIVDKCLICIVVVVVVDVLTLILNCVFVIFLIIVQHIRYSSIFWMHTNVCSVQCKLLLVQEYTQNKLLFDYIDWNSESQGIEIVVGIFSSILNACTKNCICNWFTTSKPNENRFKWKNTQEEET